MIAYKSTISLKAARILSYAASSQEAASMQKLIPTAEIKIELSTGEAKLVDRAWFGATVPAVGGYLLELADGSIGYMPGAIFESLFKVEKPETVSNGISLG